MADQAEEDKSGTPHRENAGLAEGPSVVVVGRGSDYLVPGSASYVEPPSYDDAVVEEEDTDNTESTPLKRRTIFDTPSPTRRRETEAPVLNRRIRSAFPNSEKGRSVGGVGGGERRVRSALPTAASSRIGPSRAEEANKSGGQDNLSLPKVPGEFQTPGTPERDRSDLLNPEEVSPGVRRCSIIDNDDRNSPDIATMGDDVEDTLASREYYTPLCSKKQKCIIGSSVSVVVLSVFIACLAGSLHKINEGNVGIYLKHGALMEETTMPGVHWMAPFVTVVKEISVRPQTDTLRKIGAITKDGIQNSFDDVQVRPV